MKHVWCFSDSMSVLAFSDPNPLDFTSKACHLVSAARATTECTDFRLYQTLSSTYLRAPPPQANRCMCERQPTAPHKWTNRAPCRSHVRFATDGLFDAFVTPKFQLVVLLVERQLLEEPKQRFLTVAVRTSEAIEPAKVKRSHGGLQFENRCSMRTAVPRIFEGRGGTFSSLVTRLHCQYQRHGGMCMTEQALKHRGRLFRVRRLRQSRSDESPSLDTRSLNTVEIGLVARTSKKFLRSLRIRTSARLSKSGCVADVKITILHQTAAALRHRVHDQAKHASMLACKRAGNR